MYEYRILTEGGAEHYPNTDGGRALADEIAAELRAGLAVDLFGVNVPVQRCTVEYRTVTDWAPVRGPDDPTKPPRPYYPDCGCELCAKRALRPADVGREETHT